MKYKPLWTGTKNCVAKAGDFILQSLTHRQFELMPESRNLTNSCLTRLVASLGYDEADFRSADLWITTWGVWDVRDEAIGFKVLEQFRRSYGGARSLEGAPGHYFRHDEFVESVCCLVQPVLVGWDAYYVPHWAYGYLDYFVSVSHDGFVDLEIRTREMHDRAMKVLEDHEWIRPLLRADG